MKLNEIFRKVFAKNIKVGDIIFSNRREGIYWEIKKIIDGEVFVYSKELDDQTINNGRGLIYRSEIEDGIFVLRGKNETDTNS